MDDLVRSLKQEIDQAIVDILEEAEGKSVVAGLQLEKETGETGPPFPEWMQMAQWAQDDFFHAAASQIVDAALLVASETAIHSSKVLLQRQDLGVMLPGFEAR